MFRMKSETNDIDMGTVYFMNVCCITHQPECAKTYSCKAEAEMDLQFFENLLRRIDHSEIIFEEC